MDVADYLNRTPPRSLRGLRPVSVSTTGNKAVWRLRCGCGSEEGAILSDARYTFQCEDCGQQTLVMDVDEHGEGAEIARLERHGIGCAAERFHGEQEFMKCPNCGVSRLTAVVTVTYHDDRIGEWEDDPNFPLADFFNVFWLDCRCSACGHPWQASCLDTKW